MIYVTVIHKKDGETNPVDTSTTAGEAARFLDNNRDLFDRLSVLAIHYPAPSHPDEGMVANTDVFSPEEFVEYNNTGHFETFYVSELY